MAFHKKEEFGIKEQSLAAFAKAISHPARIAILNVSAKKNECICGEIVEVLPLAQSTVSQHLKELKNAGLINELLTVPAVVIASTGKLLKNSMAILIHCLKSSRTLMQNVVSLLLFNHKSKAMKKKDQLQKDPGNCCGTGNDCCIIADLGCC